MPKVTLSTGSILLLIYLRDISKTKINDLKISASRIWFTLKRFTPFYKIVFKEVMEKIRDLNSMKLSYFSFICKEIKSHIYHLPPSTRNEGNTS